jgi:hypothetical protein
MKGQGDAGQGKSLLFQAFRPMRAGLFLLTALGYLYNGTNVMVGSKKGKNRVKRSPN